MSASTLSRPAPQLPITLPDGTAFHMVFVEGGDFLRGDIHGDIEQESALPPHRVRLGSFYIGQYPVTQALWRAVALSAEGKQRQMEPEPFYFKGSEQLPAENISWNDITQQFLPALNALTGQDFRLPTEAQWEYAARGGRHHRDGYRYAGSDKLKELAWFEDNSGGKTHEVGQKYPNQLGLYDMSGNVYEWCADAYDGDFYKTCAKSAGPIDNPFCKEGTWRVLRGGSCWIGPLYCAVAFRFVNDPAYRNFVNGFRLLLQLGATKG
ncbi:MAG TPA: formylglycine-generating enzyme family protein [Saprospiraceae bacterium]|nr:formylglycine-generating enzyme family protein [Saprospiraceae bacterium]